MGSSGNCVGYEASKSPRAGGLVVSQVLTLYTTPVVYLYLEKIRVSVNRRRGHTVADEVVPGEPATDAGIPMRHV